MSASRAKKPSRTGVEETSPDIEARLVAGYRAMRPAENLEGIASLNRALAVLARARITATYGPDLSDREMRLRLGARRLAEVTRFLAQTHCIT